MAKRYLKDYGQNGGSSYVFRTFGSKLVLDNYMIEDLLQPRHLLVILGIALLMFGPKKLPELGKGLAEGIRGFKDAIKGPEPPKE